MTARTIDASTTEGYAAALLLLAERVTRFGLRPPANLGKTGGHSLSIHLGRDGMAAVDNWVVALGLPEAHLDVDTYEATEERPAWREYKSVGVVEGIAFEVWCASDVNPGGVAS